VLPSLEYGGEYGIIITVAGIFVGALCLNLIDKLVPHLHKIMGNDNLHYNISGDVKIFSIEGREFTLEEIQKKFGGEDGSIVANPCFVDYENNDFTLKENSPALKMGFEPIDTSDVGVTVK